MCQSFIRIDASTRLLPAAEEWLHDRHSDRKGTFEDCRIINFGKLVRDKIPAKIAARQEVEVTRKIPGKLRMGFLISKLFEEALEVREAVEVTQKTEELADLFEVFRAIARRKKCRWRRLKRR